MEGLTVGRIVHFVLPGGEHRPAIIVSVWNQDTGMSNLRVFLDNKNDKRYFEGDNFQNLDLEKDNYILWATSVDFSDEHREYTWHWIERA